MTLKINIGFPVVKNQDVHAVWVSSRSSNGSGRSLKWNGVELNRQNPFGKNQMNDCFKSSNRIYGFRSPGIKDEEGVVDINGRSFEIVERLVNNYDITIHNEPDLEILLTGAVSETGLISIDDVKLKGAYAQNNRCAILLSEEDYDSLDDKSGKFYSLRPDQRLPSAIEDIQKTIEDKATGIAYPLPINSDGKWMDDTKTGWVDGLAEFLELKKSSTGANPNDFQLAEHLVTEKAETDEILPGTIGELFQKALPTELDYLYKFVGNNRDLCDKALFKDGIGEDAVKQAKDIFYTPDVERPTRNVLIGGPTGTGKTFLAEALMLNSVLEANGKIIYIAPTRSLASERYDQLVKSFAFSDNGHLDPETDIILSTGEANTRDWRLHSGRFRIAVMVNEKANIFLRPKLNMLEGVTLAIVDELHMLSDLNRGCVIDLFIAKIQEERRRRFDDGAALPLRLVGITTDRVVKQESIKKAFTVEYIIGDPIEPVYISTDKRPIPVDHQVIVYDSKSLNPPNIELITRCSGEDDLHKTDAERKALYSRIKRLSWGYTSRNSQRRAETPEKLIFQLICRIEQMEKYRNLLVAIPSIPMLDKVAKQLKNERKERYGPPSAVEEDFAYQIERSSISRSVTEDLLEYASYGIYLHSSELPNEVRDIVTSRFRKKNDDSVNRPKILLATETLFYGVNLTTDCVVLTSLKWPRQKPSDVDVDNYYLSTNEYHNILGRAGRPGYHLDADDEAQAAYICLSTDEIESEIAEITNCFDNYYGMNPIEITSELLSRGDLTKIHNDRILSMNDVSYPTFRTDMEALRHMGGPAQNNASIADIRQLLKRTVYFNSKEMKRELQVETVNKLVGRVLDCAKIEDLVSETDGKFKIEPTAEALIDTGTKWNSVSPMNAWLSTIQEFPGADALSLPIELVIPAFVSSSEFWYAARRFCWEYYEKNEDAVLQAENIRACTISLRERFQELGLDNETSELFQRSLDALIDERKAELKLPQTTFVKAVFYRLTVALILWVNGGDIDDINLLSVKKLTATNRKAKLKEVRQFKEKYRDKASWLAVMCMRYFEVKGKLRAEHRLELPRFAERLRYGVRLQGLPLINQPKSRLKREDVAVLLQKNLTPSRFLSEPETIDASELMDAVTGLNKDALLFDLRHFYRDQMTQLVGRLEQDDTLKELRAFEKLMFDAFEDDFKPDFPGLRNNVMGDLLSKSVKISSTPQNDNVSIKIQPRGERTDDLKFIMLRLVNLSSTTPSAADQIMQINVRVPWWGPDSNANEIEMTVFGSAVLCYLLGREFVTLQTVIDFLSTNRRRLTIVDLARMDMPTLPSEMKESLLRFNEPGT
jgi:hypothetical protein